MSGFFGVTAESDCTADLFYGTDYHCHLGTRRGGLATLNSRGFIRFIHDITGSQFKSKFDEDIHKMHGHAGIGVISDFEDQPLIIGSHLGTYAIVTVGAIQNLKKLAHEAFLRSGVHFSEMSGNDINPTELVATLISQEESFESGIRAAQEAIEGSCSLLVLTEKGIYVARDRYGRTPVIIGKGSGGFAVTMETCALPNLGYEPDYELGPGEIRLVTAEGHVQVAAPGTCMQMCTFLWIYYGYPASTYEGINVEAARYRCGEALANHDKVSVDIVSGIPDSGIGHALGYAQKRGITYTRPFIKYTPTWPRSFMPQIQSMRELVAKMKLIPIKELIDGKRILFCDDSIVRGTQLRDTLQRIYDYGALEIHMRPACPPLLFGCRYLNFSRSRSESELAGRRAIYELEGTKGVADEVIAEYADETSDNYHAMVETIGRRMGVTTLSYQRLDDMIQAIGLPKEKLCTYCWNGCDRSQNSCGSI